MEIPSQETTSPRTFQKRQTAVKISIAKLKQGTFIATEDMQPNYMETAYGKINRVSIMGVVVSADAENNSFVIDDRTGILTCYTQFSENLAINLHELQVGAIIHIIGKPRFFNDDLYVVPEIAFLLNDKTWLQVREAELLEQDTHGFRVADIENYYIASNESQKQDEEMIGANTEEGEEVKDSYEIIQDYMKEHDTGSGVATDDVLTQLRSKNVENAESMIKKLLEHGEIFEIMPGKIKLLE